MCGDVRDDNGSADTEVAVHRTFAVICSMTHPYLCPRPNVTTRPCSNCSTRCALSPRATTRDAWLCSHAEWGWTTTCNVEHAAEHVAHGRFTRCWLCKRVSTSTCDFPQREMTSLRRRCLHSRPHALTTPTLLFDTWQLATFRPPRRPWPSRCAVDVTLSRITPRLFTRPILWPCESDLQP